MQKALITTAVASVITLASNSAIAGAVGNNYIGIQYATGDYSEDGIPEDFNPTALVGRLGGHVNPNFSIEGRLGFGVQDDTQNIFGIDASLELDSLLGVYGVGHLNFAPSSSVYGLVGFTRVEGTASIPAIPGASATDDETDLSIGVGADIGISDTVAFNIEYISYVSKSTFDLNALGLGLTIGF